MNLPAQEFKIITTTSCWILKCILKISHANILALRKATVLIRISSTGDPRRGSDGVRRGESGPRAGRPPGAGAEEEAHQAQVPHPAPFRD